MYQKIYRTGYIAYLILVVFAIIFYKERIIFADAALHLFLILKDGFFTVQASRFGTALTQIGPLLASKLHLSLAGVMLSYSLNYILNSVICYLLCGLVFKNYRYAVMLLLCNTLIVSDSFYAVQSEILQAMPIVIAVLGYLTIKKRTEMSLIAYPILIAAIITIAFLHPLVMFMVLFAVLFHMLSKGTVADTKLFLLSAGLFFVCITIKQIAFRNSYDDNAQSGVNNFIELFPDYFNTRSTEVFIKYCIDKYYWLPILTLAITVSYVMQKAWIRLLLFLCYTIGYILLVNVSHSDGGMSDAYAETMYMPLSFIIALPFVYDVLPMFRKPYLRVGFVALIVLLGIIRIYNTRELYVNRLKWERNFMKQYNYGKVLVSDRKVPMDSLVFSWATPYECWLLSTTEAGKTASVYISDDIMKHLNEGYWDRKSLLTPWVPVEYDELPREYFKFQDTVSTYTIIR